MQHQVDHVHLWVDLLLHVVVLILHLQGHGALAIALVQLVGSSLQLALTLLKAATVVVANDVVQLGFLHRALHAQQVEKSLVALGGFGALVGRQLGRQFHGHHIGVHHLVLGIAWMHAHTFYIYARAGSVEVFKLQLAHVAAVHGVSPFAAEFLHIKMVCAHAYLLVGIECHTDVAVAYLLVVAQVAHGFHYLGNAGLVVGSQQGGAVGHYQVFAHMFQQFGKFLRTAHDAL